MKKLIIKNKKLCLEFRTHETQHLVLKSIFQNSNFFRLIRWNAFVFFRALGEISSKISVSFRCIYTINRKRFNNLTPFSRHVAIKLIQSGKICGLKKSSW